MTNFDFETWCKTTQLSKATIEALKKVDLDNDGGLTLLTGKDLTQCWEETRTYIKLQVDWKSYAYEHYITTLQICNVFSFHYN